MKKMLRWLVPKEKRLLDMIAEQSQIVLDAAQHLKAFLDEYPKFERSERKSRAQLINPLEQRCSEIKNSIIAKAKNAPDKVEICSMALLHQEIISLIKSAELKLAIFGIERIDGNVGKLVDEIVYSSSHTKKLLSSVRKSKQKGSENGLNNDRAENIYYEALSELFHYYKNSIDIMKHKDIYETLNQINEKFFDLNGAFLRLCAKE